MSAPIPYYTLPPTSSTPLDVVNALANAYRRWGSSCAVRVEDVGNTILAFRQRYRVGALKSQFGVVFFDEHGCGTTWSEAFADADLRDARPVY